MSPTIPARTVRTRSAAWLPALGLCAALLGACTTTPDRSADAASDDLGAQVYQEIQLQPTNAPKRVTVEVEDGVVTLNGSVGTREDERRIVAAAESVPGVRSVDSRVITSQ